MLKAISVPIGDGETPRLSALFPALFGRTRDGVGHGNEPDDARPWARRSRYGSPVKMAGDGLLWQTISFHERTKNKPDELGIRQQIAPEQTAWFLN